MIETCKSKKSLGIQTNGKSRGGKRAHLKARTTNRQSSERGNAHTYCRDLTPEAGAPRAKTKLAVMRKVDKRRSSSEDFGKAKRETALRYYIIDRTGNRRRLLFRRCRRRSYGRQSVQMRATIPMTCK